MRGDVLGLERRWRDADKVRIVASVGVGGVTVTQLAHHHEVTRQRIYSWRHELKKKGLSAPSAGVAFLPVDISDLRKPPEAQARYAGSAVDGRTPVAERTPASF